MSRIPKALARRIDRASRAAHRFHRFAHHPLCGRYAGEMIALGDVRLCRGCTLAIAGLVVGVSLGVLGPPLLTRGALLIVGAAVLALSRARRLPKWLGRGLPALGLGAAGASIWGLPIASAIAAAFWLTYRRKGPHRGPCAECPERTLRVCSGYAAMVKRERAFRRLSGRWLSTNERTA